MTKTPIEDREDSKEKKQAAKPAAKKKAAAKAAPPSGVMNVAEQDPPRHAKKRSLLANENEVAAKKARAHSQQPTLPPSCFQGDLSLKSEGGNRKAAPSETLHTEPLHLSGTLEVAKVPSREDEKDDDDEKLDDRLTFPERLMHLLQHEIQPKALWWQKDGVSFGFEPKLFTDKVLNKLFPTKIKFESFIRKLNRWGFRRVPGQGLPPNGAAYKHPLFKRSDPNLMKSMKFGQKVDSRRPSQQLQGLVPSTGILGGPQHAALGRAESQDNQSLVAMQALQSAQHTALLQTMAGAQQQQDHQHRQQLQLHQQRQQLALAADHLATQNAALNSLASSSDNQLLDRLAPAIDSQLRDRLLLMGLPRTIPSLQGAATLQHQHDLPSLRSLSSLPRASLSTGGQGPNASSSTASDRDIRNALLYGTGLPLSAAGHRRISTSPPSQREESSLAAAAAAAIDSRRLSVQSSQRDESSLAAAAAVLDSAAALSSSSSLDAAATRILLGGGNTSGYTAIRRPNQPENAVLHSSLLSSAQLSGQFPSQLGTQWSHRFELLRSQQQQQHQQQQHHHHQQQQQQQQASLSRQVGLPQQPGSGLSTTELWLLLQEQERQRRQNEQNDGHGQP
ncbi:HSF-type DNA-binding [Seminavis robusta]|uniref:HSF-type DNA-binding n=1 Tax=Seminavis robusta TaxID=568900 RepID=A0A9N8HD47_9STRA|nr:HSF-type DNA-binding [Seminavis robusta]|eukprot:Sro443_g143970.1 HSF-type DNA-binding (619) ;mRNA; r:1225-3358